VKGNQMPRSLLYVSAVIIVMSVVVTTLRVTTHRPSNPPCPSCGSANVREWGRHINATGYRCNNCDHRFNGPARNDFGMADAMEGAVDWADYLKREWQRD
jgi:transposase-like protein